MLVGVLAARRRPGPSPGLGAHVLVAVSHPMTAVPLGQLAAAVALPERGRVTGVTVLPLDHAADGRGPAEETLATCEVAVADEGLEVDGRLRVDASVADGLINGAVEYGASLLVLGWPPADGGPLGAPVEDLLARATVPVLLARLGGYHWERIVLLVGGGGGTGSQSQQVARVAAERLGQRHGIPVVTGDALPQGGAGAQLVVVPAAADRSVTQAMDVPPPSDVVVAVGGPRPSDVAAPQQPARGRRTSR